MNYIAKAREINSERYDMTLRLYIADAVAGLAFTDGENVKAAVLSENEIKEATDFIVERYYQYDELNCDEAVRVFEYYVTNHYGGSTAKAISAWDTDSTSAIDRWEDSITYAFM